MAARTRDDVEVPAAGSSLNAWTGMLVISLIATLVGLIFLVLDWNSYKDSPPAPVAIQPKVAPPAPKTGTPEAPPLPKVTPKVIPPKEKL